MPPLEAMACGCPAIVSRAPALREVTGGAALAFDAHDVAALAAAIRRCVSVPAARAELVARGLARARGFSWERTAQQALAVYAAARANRFRPNGE